MWAQGAPFAHFSPHLGSQEPERAFGPPGAPGDPKCATRSLRGPLGEQGSPRASWLLVALIRALGDPRGLWPLRGPLGPNKLARDPVGLRGLCPQGPTRVSSDP